MNYEPDYRFYRDEYKGKLPQEVFEEQLPASIAHVNWLIALHEVTEETARPYMRAICSVADVFGTVGHGTDGGFQIGTFRMNGNTASDSPTGEKMATDAAMKELALCGLLFQGVC